MIIVKPGPLGEPADRLLAAVAARGHVVVTGADEWHASRAAAGAIATAARATAAAADRSGAAAVTGAAVVADTPLVTLAISDGPMVFDFVGFVRSLGDCRMRALMLSRLGSHPDARTPSLQRLWRLEEHVRGGGLPTLTLRLAPLVGAATPLWKKLRSRPGLGGHARKLVNPVAEADVIDTLLRALDGRALWRGWFELAGDDVRSLDELSMLAAASPGETAGGAWEPSLEEMAEHRLAESAPWAQHFGITPTPLKAWMAKGAA